jgi:dephospho-CoA kinase
MKPKLYIGLVGSLASGKGAVADYFIKQYGFVSFSLSYIVHNELKVKGIISYTRKTLQDIGDALRAKEGDGVLAKRAIAMLNKEGSSKVVIEGIRNPGEVTYLKTLPNFILIAVDATRPVRYERVIKRGKPWDPKDWDSFVVVDSRDRRDEGNANGQQVKKCMDMAEYQIENNKDLSHLYEEIRGIVSKVTKKHNAFRKVLS